MGVQIIEGMYTSAGLEELWVSITTRNIKPLYLCAVYFAPQCINEYESHCNNTEHLSDMVGKCIGDYNLPDLQFQMITIL